jgi:hypothetical protein
MQKLIFLVRGNRKESHGSFQQRILEQAATMAREHRPAALKVTVTAYPPPAVSIIPFKKDRVAAISITGPTGKFMDTINKFEGLCGGYRVEEAIPVGYEKSWADGVQSPGVCLLTLFRQKKGIDYDTFIDRWHNSHTPLSLKLHPLWNYSRNVVKENLLDHAQPWDGIVEEHFRTPSDLLNPFKFFGNPLTIAWNMMQVYTDTRSFLDYKTIEPYLVVEYHLVSPS